MSVTNKWNNLRDENGVLQLDKNTVYETCLGWNGGLNKSESDYILAHNQKVEGRRARRNNAEHRRRMKRRGDDKDIVNRFADLEKELRENFLISLEGKQHITDSDASYASNVAKLLKIATEQKNILMDLGAEIHSPDETKADKKLVSIRSKLSNISATR